jgi:GNAT superfamily N-acetyltransferase
MEIRKGTVADIPAMTKLGAGIHKKLILSKFQEYDSATFGDNTYKVIQGDNGLWLIAWDENNVAGMLLGYISPSFYAAKQLRARCVYVFVMPDYRGKSLHRDLMANFEEWAESKGANVIAYSGFGRAFNAMFPKGNGYKLIEKTYMRRLT